MSQVVLPGGAIGILGAGQLGRMMAMAAKHMGYRVVVVGASPQDPAAQVADEWIEGDLMDPGAALRLATRADVITIETENVSVAGLEAAARERPVHPSPAIVAIAQNRLKEKGTLSAMGVPVAPYRKVCSLAELSGALAEIGCPAILKTARGGYDGKGQARIATPAGAAAAFEALGAGRVDLVVEAVVPFQKEISVVIARDAGGNTAAFPVVENEHRRGILHRSVAPAQVDPGVERLAVELAKTIATSLDLTGMLAVEMFALPGGELIVNELAPRPHNSGHYTLDACATTQFEQVIRACAGLGLGSVAQHMPAVMLNILGEHVPGVLAAYPELMQDPLVKVHLYGKSEARPGRKMGHLLAMDPDAARCLQKAETLWRRIVS